ncbi:putative E3 ubiquitin-protein ligase arkadia-A [Heracleum sosnowskyi]|uniref:E3 ubiquitin-protein ligase arkadia-A n=1 Tax=Heracleum sosnowskyi TaxID=360622 RepID=A0AAD8I0T6_9APIA|nr:putative E3 ubiquitin-protein ligase arkadia-A [Heracleum sosnowskyi]
MSINYMEPDSEKLKILRSFNLRSDSFKLRRTDLWINRDHDPDICCQGYTSLRDVIHSPPTKSSSLIESSAFDSSTISIRNELVKHAASVYVQSAITSSRDTSFFANLLDKLKHRGKTFQSCCAMHLKKPLQSCFGVIYRFFSYMANHFVRVWRRSVAIR